MDCAIQRAHNAQGTIHLYFHAPCFDGVTTAAIAIAYLEQVKGYSQVPLHGVNYHLKDQWLTTNLVQPCAVVDFLYHPAADLWADHHPTTFLTDQAKQHYESRRGPDLFYDSQATSCALLVWCKWGDALSDLADHFRPLVHWADRIDSARYESVNEAISLQSPALQINLALGTSRDQTFSRRLVNLFREKSLEEVAALPAVRTEFEKGWNLQQQGLGRLRDAVHLTDNGIVVFDVNGDDVLVNRYAPFDFYPHARYSAGIVRTSGKAKITSMRNPWMEFPSAPLGQLCATLGGGGHRRVGSILVQDRDPQEVLASLLKAVAAWERQPLPQAAS